MINWAIHHRLVWGQLPVEMGSSAFRAPFKIINRDWQPPIPQGEAENRAGQALAHLRANSHRLPAQVHSLLTTILGPLWQDSLRTDDLCNAFAVIYFWERLHPTMPSAHRYPGLMHLNTLCRRIRDGYGMPIGQVPRTTQALAHQERNRIVRLLLFQANPRGFSNT